MKKMDCCGDLSLEIEKTVIEKGGLCLIPFRDEKFQEIRRCRRIESEKETIVLLSLETSGALFV